MDAPPTRNSAVSATADQWRSFVIRSGGCCPAGCEKAHHSPCDVVMHHLMKLAVGVRDPAHLHAIQAARVVQDTAAAASHPADAPPGCGNRCRRVDLLGDRRVDAGPPADRGHRADTYQDGSACAALILDPALVGVAGRPVRPFQGWRYLAPEAAPEDLGAGGDDGELPPALGRPCGRCACYRRPGGRRIRRQQGQKPAEHLRRRGRAARAPADPPATAVSIPPCTA